MGPAPRQTVGLRPVRVKTPADEVDGLATETLRGALAGRLPEGAFRPDGVTKVAARVDVVTRPQVDPAAAMEVARPSEAVVAEMVQGRVVRDVDNAGRLVTLLGQGVEVPVPDDEVLRRAPVAGPATGKVVPTGGDAAATPTAPATGAGTVTRPPRPRPRLAPDVGTGLDVAAEETPAPEVVAEEADVAEAARPRPVVVTGLQVETQDGTGVALLQGPKTADVGAPEVPVPVGVRLGLGPDLRKAVLVGRPTFYNATVGRRPVVEGPPPQGPETVAVEDPVEEVGLGVADGAKGRPALRPPEVTPDGQAATHAAGDERVKAVVVVPETATRNVGTLGTKVGRRDAVMAA